MTDALKKYFGFDTFRPLQQEIVEAVLKGNDVFALMPTGAGKSLCFQLPAVLLPGITIVISPLIALMKDQVDGLNADGIPATFLNSSLDGQELYARIRGLKEGKYKLLYVAPERFPTPGFLEFLDELTISLCVVDEAHCISEWGHDFRADYRNLHVLRKRFPNAPIMAVTATATEQVLADILQQLHLRKDTSIFRASFDRKNLIYQVWPKRGGMAQLVGYLDKKKGESGIIYCLSRASTEKVAASLKAQGHNAKAYHAGLEKNIRAKTQELFVRDKVDIICATIAFGMGIDKPNVRFVIHYDIPKNIPGYYQETGRAGRDGLSSDCILFNGAGDRMKYMRFFNDKTPEERMRAIQELDLMVDLAESTSCRRKSLLGYFGEEYPNANCGTCDNCISTQHAESFDGTRLAQMFLSCVVRVKENFGQAYIIDVLKGSRGQKILDFRHHELPTYGVGHEYTKEEWRHFANEFRRQGLVVQDHNRFSVVKMTRKGWDVLKNGLKITIDRATHIEHVSREAMELPAPSMKLFEELRKLRRAIAEQQSVPPYVIFNDYTLKEIAARLPVDGQEFLAISGVGEVKARQYGMQFLSLVRIFLKENPSVARTKEVRSVVKSNQTVSNPSEAPRLPRQAIVSGSAFETLGFFKKGYSPAKIAGIRGFAVSTINTQIADLIRSGYIKSIDHLVEPSKLSAIREAFQTLGFTTLTAAKEHLGDAYSYEDLRFVRAFDERKK